ncbi:cell division protein FtsW [Saccharicrinis carchari]|uniref:Probable peptidoglycan glycosyltransferase FtsW n=1 Tax=Saccharicrinis carchari TaxID=1168039 RepID=A0A521C6B7_SACCC|nr:putative peptidoglycan glycosyltransferase FtsW [Saccharicrinis carchari]SMO54220.1 cell division protein FtsW [Saccharicrinis carchari]
MGIRATLQKYFKGDPILWGVIAFLAAISLLAVYSATGSLAYRMQGGNTYYYMMKHLVFLLLGMLLMLWIHQLNYRIFAKYATVALWVSIGLLALTLITGISLNQASRWLTLPGIGVSFQPSELAKIALVMYIARTLARNQDEKVGAKEAFKPIMIYVTLVCALIFTEDFSTAFLIGFTAFLLMFIGRVPAKYLLGTIGVVGLMAVILFFASPHLPFLHRAATWKARIERFVDDDDQVSEGSYQSRQAQMAVATGGFFGKGPGNSKQRNFLPHPYSDFIFAIIVEEWGLLGALLVVMSYMVFLFRAGVLVRGSTRTFPAFLAIGLSYLLVFQGFFNMGVAVGIFPVTGQPLPLVSMGGTSILFTCIAMGAILSVSRNNMEEAERLKKKAAAAKG